MNKQATFLFTCVRDFHAANKEACLYAKSVLHPDVPILAHLANPWVGTRTWPWPRDTSNHRADVDLSDKVDLYLMWTSPSTSISDTKNQVNQVSGILYSVLPPTNWTVRVTYDIKTDERGSGYNLDDEDVIIQVFVTEKK